MTSVSPATRCSATATRSQHQRLPRTTTLGLAANTPTTTPSAPMMRPETTRLRPPSVSAKTLADTTAPTVSLTAPANGATVSGTINVTATASDNVGVVGVQFLLDGNNLGAEDTTAPYSVSWNTSTATNGAHVLTARARDAADNSTTSAARNVRSRRPIRLAPTVAITSPTNNAQVVDIVNVTADASDNVGVAGVQFLVDGVNRGPVGHDRTVRAGVGLPNRIEWNTYSRCASFVTLPATRHFRLPSR